MKLEKSLEEFMENFAKARPATIYLEPIPGRKEEVLASMRELAELIWLDAEDAEIKIEHDPLLGTCLELNVRAETITFRDMDRFSAAIEVASNFIIYPDTDGKQNFCVTYDKVYKRVKQ